MSLPLCHLMMLLSVAFTLHILHHPLLLMTTSFDHFYFKIYSETVYTATSILFLVSRNAQIGLIYLIRLLVAV